MKVLFLDIDGVLNRTGTKEKVQFMGTEFDGIDRELLARLQGWLADKEVAIVLSSTWRHHDDLIAHLREVGLDWISQTPHLHRDRGEEIAMWLRQHPEVTHFAIIDDMCDMKPVMAHLVQTSEKHGLQDKHLRKLAFLLDLAA